MIVLFLVPVTFAMHNFRGIADPAIAQNQMVHFMKNLWMLGGALLGAMIVQPQASNLLRL